MRAEPVHLEAVEQERFAETIDANVHMIGTALRAIHETVEHITDRDYLAALLVDLTEQKRDLGRVYDAGEKALLAVAGEKRFEVPGLGQVEVKRRKSYKEWQHEDLVRAVVARIADEPGLTFDEDGTRLPTSQLVANVVGRLREAMTPSWKVTGLREFGIDESEYCTVVENDWSVKLPPRPAS